MGIFGVKYYFSEEKTLETGKMPPFIYLLTNPHNSRTKINIIGNTIIPYWKKLNSKQFLGYKSNFLAKKCKKYEGNVIKSNIICAIT